MALEMEIKSRVALSSQPAVFPVDVKLNVRVSGNYCCLFPKDLKHTSNGGEIIHDRT